MVPKKVSNHRQLVVFNVLASATDTELDELAIVVVEELDRQAAEHDRAEAEADLEEPNDGGVQGTRRHPPELLMPSIGENCV